MKRPTPIKRVSLILLLIVLLPALFYSGYQISALSETEELMSDVYRRQLDAILYSLNQYTLDVANSWVSSLAMIMNEQGRSPAPHQLDELQIFRERSSSIVGVFRTDSTLREVHIVSPVHNTTPASVSENDIRVVLQKNRDKVLRLAEFRREQYRKLEPLPLAAGQSSVNQIALVFSVGPETVPGIAGIVIDEATFIREIILRKIREAAGTEFTLAVVRDGDPNPVIATAEISPGKIRQEKAIWVLPGYSLGINLRGATIEELVRSRATRNLVLILLLDSILIAGVLLVYRNIRKEMELARIKSDLVSNVSHELRTPLALIRMYAETLEMGRLTDEKKKQDYYGTIVRESERLTRLVNRILDFSSMQAGKKQYTFAQVQLNDVIAGVLQTYSIHLLEKGFAPITDLGDKLPPVRADAEAVSEALINILDNAIKYSGERKFLRVASGVGAGMVWIEVEDHGIGIPAAQQQRVFEMFYRVSTGHVHDRKGTGIGLALVKHIMDAHRGKVTLKSTAGQGSTFCLSFPVTE